MQHFNCREIQFRKAFIYEEAPPPMIEGEAEEDAHYEARREREELEKLRHQMYLEKDCMIFGSACDGKEPSTPDQFLKKYADLLSKDSTAFSAAALVPEEFSSKNPLYFEVLAEAAKDLFAQDAIAGIMLLESMVDVRAPKEHFQKVMAILLSLYERNPVILPYMSRDVHDYAPEFVSLIEERITPLALTDQQFLKLAQIHTNRLQRDYQRNIAWKILEKSVEKPFDNIVKFKAIARVAIGQKNEPLVQLVLRRGKPFMEDAQTRDQIQLWQKNPDAIPELEEE